jgi:hypothetical protein
MILHPVPANISGNFLKQFLEHYVSICVFKITPDTIDESNRQMSLYLKIGGPCRILQRSYHCTQSK